MRYGGLTFTHTLTYQREDKITGMATLQISKRTVRERVFFACRIESHFDVTLRDSGQKHRKLREPLDSLQLPREGLLRL